MCTLNKYSFHYREKFWNGSFKNHFLEASAYDVEKAKEIALMGTSGKPERFELVKDLSDYSTEDYIDYIIINDRVGPIYPEDDPHYIKAKRNNTIKELLEDE